MRREWSGLSGPPKLGLVDHSTGVGERSHSGEARAEACGWSGGKCGCRNEYAQIGVRTPDTGSPRVPAPWQSAQGEAAPKVRPQRRSRWTSGSRFPPHCQIDEPSRDRGTKRQRPCGRPSNGVGGDPETGTRGDGLALIRVLWSRHARKAAGGGLGVTVP